MAGSRLREMIGRRPIRLRLTLTYSALFVLAGAMLLAFTYFFVVRGLQPPAKVKTPVSQLAAFRQSCEKAMKAPAPPDKNLIFKCQNVFRAGVKAGAESQRANAVHQLLLYSLIGLGVIGLLSGLIGWLVAGRALRPIHAITSAARKASEENLGEHGEIGVLPGEHPPVAAGQGQQRLDKRLGPVHRRPDLGRHVLELGHGALRLGQRHVDGRAHDGQRRAQLV